MEFYHGTSPGARTFGIGLYTAVKTLYSPLISGFRVKTSQGGLEFPSTVKDRPLDTLDLANWYSQLY